MNHFKQLFVTSAFVFLGLDVALTVAIITAIWGDFDSETVWKMIGTIGVLFIFSGFVHAVARGLCQKPKANDSSAQDE